jgi:hypothetical protein
LAGNAAIISAIATVTSPVQNVTFRNCAFQNGGVWSATSWFILEAVGQTPVHFLFDRCRVFARGTMTITLGTGNGAGTGVGLGAPSDYDADYMFNNCWIFAPTNTSTILITNSGTATGKGGGVRFRNCTLFLANGMINTTAAQISTTIPCEVRNSVLTPTESVASNALCLNAGTLGQIVEDYNILTGTTARTNVAIGARSISDGSYAIPISLTRQDIYGQRLDIRPYAEPLKGSGGSLGFGAEGYQPLDLEGRTRPAGGGANSAMSVGALESGDTATQGTTPVPNAGTKVWKQTGAWQQDFQIPVIAGTTTITVDVQRDTAYSSPAGGLPSLRILANARLGVTEQTITDTGSVSVWNTLTAASFTSTGSGWVTVRISSYDVSGLSVVAFSNFTVT